MDQGILALQYLPHNIHYVIIGTNEGEQWNLQEYAKSLGLTERVHFLGPKFGKEKVDWIKNSFALLVPSKFEIQGLVILEAMSQKIPVIAANVGGIPELINHNINGYLYSFGDVKSFVPHLVKCFGNLNHIKKIKYNGLRTSKKYSWQKLCQKIEQQYASC